MSNTHQPTLISEPFIEPSAGPSRSQVDSEQSEASD